MPLIDIEIRHAKPREKAYELADMQGLFLLISPSGSKLWRMKYRFGGAGRKLSFGPYPQVSLRDARKHRDDARDLLAALRRRELDRLGQQVAADTGRTSMRPRAATTSPALIPGVSPSPRAVLR